MTTVIDATTVPGVRTLYRIAVCLAAVSGAFCILFCAMLAIHYHGLLRPGGTTVLPGAEVPPSSDPSYRSPASDSYNRLPTDYHSFLDLRNKLAQDPKNDDIRAQIRQLDRELRTEYFQRRITIHRMALLLIVASVFFFAAMRTISVLKRRLPDPGNFKTQKNKQSEPKWTWTFAVAIAWFMLFVGLMAGLLLAPPPQMEQIFSDKLVAEAGAPVGEAGVPAQSHAGESEPVSLVVTQPTPTLPQTAAIPVATATNVQTEAILKELAVIRQDIRSLAHQMNRVASPATAPRLTEEVLAKNWASFRNFDGNGIGFSDNPPIHWDGTTGKNIIWKSEVPLAGKSSPVIWGDHLFLTGADEESQRIFCYHTANGDLLWTADVTRTEAKATEVGEDTGYAAPTPVVDGKHVYAMFANGELVAVDFSGKEVWRHSFGTPDNSYGFASSPALCFDRLIVQFDDGDGSAGNSKLVALELETGDVLWNTVREECPNSWSSPTIKKIGDAYQIITSANPYVIAYNPENGDEIWRVKCLSGDVGPSAVALGSVVLVTNDAPRTVAIDPTGTGDVTATHILWTGAGATSDAPSPLATENFFLTISSGGWLSGYDPTVIDPNRKRARYWELEIGDMSSFYSSPLRVGTYIYMFDKSEVNEARGSQPRAFVVDLSKIAVGDDGSLTEESAAAMIIAENPMPEPVVTCPALLNDRIYVRGEKTLYCIGEN